MCFQCDVIESVHLRCDCVCVYNVFLCRYAYGQYTVHIYSNLDAWCIVSQWNIMPNDAFTNKTEKSIIFRGKILKISDENNNSSNPFYT